MNQCFSAKKKKLHFPLKLHESCSRIIIWRVLALVQINFAGQERRGNNMQETSPKPLDKTKPLEKRLYCTRGRALCLTYQQRYKLQKLEPNPIQYPSYSANSLKPSLNSPMDSSRCTNQLSNPHTDFHFHNILCLAIRHALNKNDFRSLLRNMRLSTSFNAQNCLH